jgi:hypothetical protein
LAWAIGILFVDVFSLFFLILLGEHFWMGWPVFGLSLASIAVLIYIARKAPSNALTPKAETPTRRPFVFGILGAVFYPSVLFVEFFGMGAKLPAYAVTPLVVLLQTSFLVYVLRVIGRTNNERNLIVLAAGLISPLAIFGIVSQISLPLVIVVDIELIAFFAKLWRMYPKEVSARPKLENSAIA